jgi:hypothetical protein
MKFLLLIGAILYLLLLFKLSAISNRKEKKK